MKILVTAFGPFSNVPAKPLLRFVERSERAGIKPPPGNRESVAEQLMEVLRHQGLPALEKKGAPALIRGAFKKAGWRLPSRLPTSFYTYVVHSVQDRFQPLRAAVSPPPNTAALVLERLERSGWRMNPEIRLVYGQLPVEYRRGAVRLAELIESYHPDAIVLTGLDGNASGIKLERFARNRVSRTLADNAGFTPAARQINQAGPFQLKSTLPLGLFRERLVAKGLPVEISTDAGDFLCNTVFYQVRHQHPHIPAGFVHFPHAREIAEELVEQGAARRNPSQLSLEAAVLGLQEILLAVAEALAGRKR